MWGVRRGLFSNEAGQGSAPIAHAAAKTDEPVSEGVVALLEPFIDTIVICTMTGLIILMTGVWDATFPTELQFSGGDSSYVSVTEDGGMKAAEQRPERIRVADGIQEAGAVQLAWHEVAVAKLFVDAEQTIPFSGVILPGENQAQGNDGQHHSVLYGDAVEAGAPLTQIAFQRGLSPLGNWGQYIVILSVLLFGISTAISWSYYGDRCASYLFGAKALLPFKIAYVIAHFLGAIIGLAVVWTMGDVALGIVIFPNLIALILLSGTVARDTDSYFERKPWLKNAEDHRRWVESHKKH